MNRKLNTAALMLLFFLMAVTLTSFPILAFNVITIVGEVNDSNQIISDGEIYEVEDTQQGNDLVQNHVSRKVEVTGKLRIEGDMRIIDVTAFEVVEK